MANLNILKQIYNKNLNVIIPKASVCKILKNQRRNLCDANRQSRFDNLLADCNLVKCINRMNGLHYQNATSEEKKKFFEIKKKEMKRAAVLVAFCYDQNEEPSILFTLRSPHLAIHKWEICFPGGHLCDLQDDGDITKTASRETKEELGVCDDSINIIGVLNPLPGKQSNTFIFPVLAKIDLSKQGSHNKAFHNKSHNEVEEVIVRPLKELLKNENWHVTHWTTGYTSPAFIDEIFNDKSRPRIWGLTSYILFQVLSNLAPDHFNLPYLSLDRYRK